MAAGPEPIPQLIERKATVQDVPAIFGLISHWADQRQMLPKPIHAIYRSIREFWVLEEAGEIVGCCGLRIYSENLAEVCSLAIAPGHQGQGLGPVLVNNCLAEARNLGIKRVFALTYQVRFFERLGFAITPIENLPEKVFQDCTGCPFLNNCNETALIIQL